MATAQATKNDPMDLLAEDLISMSQAAREIPGGVHIGTLYRWADGGIKPVGGKEKVKLETVRVGTKRRTSVQALHRFLKRTQ